MPYQYRIDSLFEWIAKINGPEFGDVLDAGTHDVAAPIGRPPVFTREDSEFAPLFVTVADRTV